MNKRRRVYEGKAKVLYEGPEPGTLIQHFKDDATAFNNKKHALIEGKGVLNNRISEHIFTKLGEIGVPTHFVRRLNMREQLIREVEIIPLEVVVRNVAAGSLAQRLGLEEGKPLPRSIIEFYYKNDALGDPMVCEEHITAFGWANPPEIDEIMALAPEDQRLPRRPVLRHRHPPRRLQGGVRPALGERADAHRARRRDQPGLLPALGRGHLRQAGQGPFPPRPRAACSRLTRKWRAAWACSPRTLVPRAAGRCWSAPSRIERE